MWQAILDPVTGTVLEAIDLFDGLQLDGYEIEEKIVRGQPLTATIKTHGRHRLSIAEFRGIRANVHGHQEYFPDDTFFAHSAELANQKVYWGISAPSPMGGGSLQDEEGDDDSATKIVL